MIKNGVINSVSAALLLVQLAQKRWRKREPEKQNKTASAQPFYLSSWPKSAGGKVRTSLKYGIKIFKSVGKTVARHSDYY